MRKKVNTFLYNWLISRQGSAKNRDLSKTGMLAEIWRFYPGPGRDAGIATLYSAREVLQILSNIGYRKSNDFGYSYVAAI